MSGSGRRAIYIFLQEDMRACENCETPLSGKEGMIYVIVPDSVVLEYCSWKCMFTHVKELLKSRSEAKRLLARNMIQSMGYTREIPEAEWGAPIPREELEAPIEDTPG